MQEEDFWVLLTRYLDKEATVEDIDRLTRYVQQDEKYRRYFEDMVAQWDVIRRLPQPEFDVSAAKGRVMQSLMSVQSSAPKRFPGRWIYAVAASLLLLVVSYVVVRHATLREPVWHEVATASGERMHVVLPDSTKIWLNAQSTLAYTYDEENVRRVRLEGEAFFDVTRNSSRPFIIESNGMSTTVLGTSFNVLGRKNADQVVSVITGKVAVSSTRWQERLLVTPGEKVVFEHAGHRLQKYTVGNLEEAIAWKDGVFIFDNQPLHEVLQKLAVVYAVQFKASDPRLLRCLVRGRFHDESLPEILSLIGATVDFTFKQTNQHEYTLTGKGCE
jgi:transmembrane sensor